MLLNYLIVISIMHTIAIKKNDNVLVFGCNYFGQLGLNHNDDQNKPILLMQKIPIRQITCGNHHTIILQENSNVLVFGCNDDGQLGLGHYKSQNKPTKLIQNVALLSGYCANPKWSSENHRQFGTTFRNRIHCFLLVHKRNQNNTGLKIPKFVLFEIFKKV